MLDISVVTIKRTSQDAALPEFKVVGTLYKPGSAGSKFCRRCSSHLGCVKSPVPKTWMPFFLPHNAKLGMVISAETARLYAEWICKSAIMCISKLYSAKCKTKSAKYFLLCA